MASEVSDQVEKFFESNPSFVCQMLHAKILRTLCYRRMTAEKPAAGSGLKKAESTMDAFCRSGKCECGLETVRVLGREDEYEKMKKAQDKDKKSNVSKPCAPASL